jgi:lambda family phage tail tape measure protein
MVAQLNLAKTALAQVSANQADYNQKLEFSRQVSTDYSVGLQATIEGYSKVTAAAAANGLTLKETETIYRGLLASGVAFGASQDDLQSIITATTQILSKGKISAEELSGQLGERIPGAVAKFAQATGRPLAQLAKDLQDGKVNIADFVKFAKGQLDDYDKAAKLIGSSPEKAGERLNLALTRMAESYGGFFQTVGAGFQDFATRFINWINSQSQGIKTMVGLLNWAGREVYKFQTNTPAVRAFQSLSSQLSGSSRQRPPEGLAFSSNDPYGVGRSPFMAAPQGKVQDPFANFFADRLSEGNRLFPEFKPTLFNQNTSAPILGDLTAADDKAAKKAAKAADAAARKAQAEADRATQLQEKLDSEQRRRDELLANNAIRLADQVFQHRIDLLRQEYDLKQQLVEATRSAEEAGMTGVARNMQGTINQILSLYDRVKQGGLNNLLDLRQADQRITTERKSAQNTARYADVPQSAVGARTSGANNGMATLQGMPGISEYLTGDSRMKGAGYEPAGHGGARYHEHIATINKRLRDELMAELKRKGFVIGSVDRNTHTYHGAQRAFDVPAYPNLQNLGLPDNKAGEQEFSRMVRAAVTDYLTGSGRNLARTQPGVAQGINRNIVDTGNTDIATADKAALVAKQKQDAQYLFQIAEKQAEALIKNTTTSYRDQTQALQDQLQEFRERNRLQMEGVKPEIIDQQMQLNKLTRDYARESETLSSALKSIGERNKDNASLFDTLTNGLKNLTAAYDENRQSQEALNKAQNDKRYIFNFDESVKAGIDSYITSIGTLNEAVTGLTQKGFGGLQSSIKELVTTGSTDFKTFALNMISDMLDVIIQQLIVAQFAQMIRNILGGITGASSAPGGGGGGFGGTGVDFGQAMNMPKLVANGGVMTSSGPLKLQTYARGGIADRPQMALFGEGSSPEAYVPLPDGRRIPVAMRGGAGGGGISVSVNVDAGGTKAEGNSDRSAAIGKELGSVIEAKIISMKRPGGLLYDGNS